MTGPHEKAAVGIMKLLDAAACKSGRAVVGLEGPDTKHARMLAMLTFHSAMHVQYISMRLDFARPAQ
jgi:hypothetical protein